MHGWKRVKRLLQPDQPPPKKTPETVDLPIVEIGQTSVAENKVAESPADVAVTSEEGANWFWNLLEQVGYELV